MGVHGGTLRALAFVAATGVLAACAGLIGPVAVVDLFGVDGLVVNLEAVDGVATAELLDPATRFSGALAVVLESAGFDVPDFVDARGLQEMLVLESELTVIVPGDSGALLGDFALTSGALSLALSEGGTELGSASGEASFAPAVAVTKGACSYDAAADRTTCAYAAALDPTAHAITIEASSASASALFAALRDGGTFTVAGTYAVELAGPGLTASAVVRVSLASLGGTIAF